MSVVKDLPLFVAMFCITNVSGNLITCSSLSSDPDPLNFYLWGYLNSFRTTDL